MRDAICPVCGRAFQTRNGRQVYCSMKCNNIVRKNREKAKAEANLVRNRRKPKSNGEIIDAYSREANRRHISYGALQAERYIRKMREG